MQEPTAKKLKSEETHINTNPALPNDVLKLILDYALSPDKQHAARGVFGRLSLTSHLLHRLVRECRDWLAIAQKLARHFCFTEAEIVALSNLDANKLADVAMALQELVKLPERCTEKTSNLNTICDEAAITLDSLSTKFAGNVPLQLAILQAGYRLVRQLPKPYLVSKNHVNGALMDKLSRISQSLDQDPIITTGGTS